MSKKYATQRPWTQLPRCNPRHHQLGWFRPLPPELRPGLEGAAPAGEGAETLGRGALIAGDGAENDGRGALTAGEGAEKDGRGAAIEGAAEGAEYEDLGALITADGCDMGVRVGLCTPPPIDGRV